MIRCRFFTHEPDYRPVVWPLKHPYWCTGSGENSKGDYWVIVAYADDEAEIMKNWPEAFALDSEKRDSYLFTSRFARPDWFTDTNGVPVEVKA